MPMEKPNYEFIRETRIACGFSQFEIAEAVHCSSKTISNLENGKPISSQTLFEIMNVLNLELRRNNDTTTIYQ